jgi:poly(A) polymerase
MIKTSCKNKQGSKTILMTSTETATLTSVAPPNTSVVTTYTRSQHTVSRAQISNHALKVLYQLKRAGFDAYLVGGCVRDLLLGREPKDFDVVTNANPDQVKRVFHNCRLIGRRFRLAHIHFGQEVIEVATFRGASTHENSENQQVHEDGRLLRDNVYGTLEEDVWRRDFTVNALYYNIRDFSIVDYADGMQDLNAAVLRLIGEPAIRYREDPVRMLRAVRFAVKLGFILHPDCEKPLHELAGLLDAVPAARLYEEVLKLFLYGYGLQTFEMLRHYGLFAILFPDTDRCLETEDHHFPRLFLAKALENSDKRIADGKSITPYFLLAAFLWEPLRTLAEKKIHHGENPLNAYQNAANEVLNRQINSIAIPKYITQAMREVWLLQLRLQHCTGIKPFRLLEQPRFRAAYDFLVLRAETGGADRRLAQWWTEFQAADESKQRKMTRSTNASSRKRGSGKAAAKSKPVGNGSKS